MVNKAKEWIANHGGEFAAENNGYGVAELVETRGGGKAEIAEAEEYGDDWCTFKVPSGSEASIPLFVVKYLAGGA